MNSSLFDVPSIEIFLKRGEAARIAVGHLEHVLTQAPNTPELAEPAALAVLYATIRIVECPSKIVELPHFRDLLAQIRWALYRFFEEYSDIAPAIQSQRLNDCLLAIEEHTTLPPFSEPPRAPLEDDIETLGWEARLILSDTTLSEGFHNEPLGPDEFRDAVRTRILAMATRVRSKLVLWDKITELAGVVNSSSS